MCFSYWKDKRSAHLALRNLVVTCMLVLIGCMPLSVSCFFLIFQSMGMLTTAWQLDNCSFGRLEFPGQIGFNFAACFMLVLALGLLISGYASYKAPERGSFSASIHSTAVCRNQGISRLELKGFDYILYRKYFVWSCRACRISKSWDWGQTVLYTFQLFHLSLSPSKTIHSSPHSLPWSHQRALKRSRIVLIS